MNDPDITLATTTPRPSATATTDHRIASQSRRLARRPPGRQTVLFLLPRQAMAAFVTTATSRQDSAPRLFTHTTTASPAGERTRII
ncbi:hypothetical protein EYF80_067982 [Liparis tanakae]|uniref:Uncharacterized protein n=1 Tax=Liparis tanakae TaxID=230148 RepID=A0A4Z2DZN5_9TELE|nr:hypothetical protein EYF80_067982 [Liparis tanakae]